MPGTSIASSVALFLLAGLCEIGGGWLVWQWLRESRSWLWGLGGGLVLCLYGVIPTFQPAHFGRVYAAYGDFLLFCRSCGVGFLTATGLIANGKPVPESAIRNIDLWTA